MSPLVILAMLGTAGAATYLLTGTPSAKPKGKSPESDPFQNIPESHKGKKLLKNDSTAKSGRRYVTHSTGPDAKDDVFVIAVSKSAGSPWISYLANRQTTVRRLHRAFASGTTKAARDEQVAKMMADFGVKS